MKSCPATCELEAKIKLAKHMATFTISETVRAANAPRTDPSIPVHLPWSEAQSESSYSIMNWSETKSRMEQLETFWSEYDKKMEAQQNDCAWGEELDLFECWKLENAWALELLVRRPVDPTLVDIVKRRFIRAKKMPVSYSNTKMTRTTREFKDEHEPCVVSSASRQEPLRATVQETKETTSVASANATNVVKHYKSQPSRQQGSHQYQATKAIQDKAKFTKKRNEKWQKQGIISKAQPVASTMVSQANPFDALDQEED